MTLDTGKITGDTIEAAEWNESATAANKVTDQTLVVDDISDFESAVGRGLQASGIISGGVVTINSGDNAKVDVSAGTGVIIDWSTPTAPVFTDVTWTAKIAVTLTALATDIFTSLYIDVNGDLQQIAGAVLSPQQKRLNIGLDAAVHNNFTTIENIATNGIQAYQVSNAILDYLSAIGVVNAGNGMSANSTNLTVAKAAGTTTLPFINRDVDSQNPSIATNAVQTPLNLWSQAYQDGSGGTTFITSVTAVDSDLYDDGSGTLASLANNKWTIHRFYFFGQNEAVVETFGQAIYSSLAEATAAVFTENPIVDPLLETGAFVTALIVKKGTTNLSSTDNVFVNITTQTSAAGAGAGAQDLQNTYDLSTTPEIVTDSTRGAFTVEGGTGTDTDFNFEVKNNAGSTTLTVDANGDIDMVDGDLKNIKVAEFQEEVDNGNSGATKTIVWTAGNNQKVTISATTTLSFTNPSGPARLQLNIVDGDLFAVTFPTITWLTSGGTAPTLDGTDYIVLFFDGTNYIGVHANQT